jgi:thioredoxin reductase (NADPH)
METMTILEEPQEFAEDIIRDAESLIERYDAIVIGGGISGLSAGLYAARSGMRTLILEGEFMSSVDYPGGQLMLTPEIENYPGFTGGSGMDLIETARTQAEKSGAEILEGRVSEITFSSSESLVHTVHVDDVKYHTKTVIIATGAIARRLEIPGEDTFFGRGVSTCATCDGAFFKDKPVAVVGGGDVAVEDALYLTKHASHVYLIHRRDTLRTSSPSARTLLEHPNVTVLWDTTVDEVFGSQFVEGVFLNREGKTEPLVVNGLFVAIGHDPQSEVCANSGDIIEVDGHGYIVANGTRTNVPGIFVAGDVADAKYRQAITAAATGAMSAMDALHYLNS